MNNLKTLFLFRLKNQMKLFNLSSTNKEVRKHAFYTTLGYAAAFLMFLGYVLFISIDLNADNNTQAFFVLISSILFWTFGIWNNLSGFDDIIDSKDSDFIFSLPIKNWEAKLLPLLSKYFIQIILTFIVLIFGYILTISVINNYLFVFIKILLLSFIIPLLSTNLTFLIALLVRNLLTIIKLRNNITESILTLGIFAAPLIYFMFKSESINYKEVFINASILRYSLDEIINFHFFLNLILLSTVAMITTFIVIFTLVNSHDPLKNKKDKQLKTRNVNAAWTIKTPIITLLLKEIKLYLSSLTYVSNTMLTPVAMIVLNICILIGVIPNFHDFSYDLAGFTITAQQIFIMIIFALLMLTTTTSCSLSFEGRSIWLMLVSPISIHKIALAKISINILLFLPGILLSTFVLYSVFNVDTYYLIAVVALFFSTLFFISITGFLVNLLFPTYTWSNDMGVVKQSKATIITAVISMIAIPIMMLIVYIDNVYWILLMLILEIVIMLRMMKKISNSNMMLN